MTEQEVKELLFEITEYFRAEENGSVEPEQLLKANTLILYKDLYIYINDNLNINIYFSFYDLLYCGIIDQCFKADNFQYKKSVLIYNNFLLCNDLTDNVWGIVKYINNSLNNNQLHLSSLNELFEDTIQKNQIKVIGYNSMRHFKANCDLTIQNPIAIIDDLAFFNNKYIHDIKIYADLEYIEYQAFAASSLSSIYINSCYQIKSDVFLSCIDLKTCNLPNNLSSIERQAFEKCENLRYINLEDTQITTIPDRLFYGCKSLTSIAIPNSVSSIGQQAFEGCTNLSVISFENFDHVVATNIYDYKLPDNLSIVVPHYLIDQWKEVEEAETPSKGYYSIKHLVCKHA